MNSHAQFFVRAGFAAYLLLTGAAGADERGQLARGHNIAVHICGACHAVEHGQKSSPIGGAPPFERIANTHKTTRFSLRVILQSLHPIMPNVRLSEDERTDVIEYLLSLRRISVGWLDATGRASPFPVFVAAKHPDCGRLALRHSNSC